MTNDADANAARLSDEHQCHLFMACWGGRKLQGGDTMDKGFATFCRDSKETC